MARDPSSLRRPPGPIPGRRRRHLPLAPLLALFVFAPSALGERSIEDAVYSRAQARDGKKLYDQHCIACHERGYFREVLRVRRGEALDALFEIMVTEMPQNDPGSLSDREYVDVIAYMLNQSRYAAGDARLEIDDLGDITIPQVD